jgi:predicted O-methyltransferase YrrM
MNLPLVFAALATVFAALAAFVSITTLREVRQSASRLEALQAVHAVLRPSAPMPPYRPWAASPQLVRQIVTAIFERRPKLVVELGSGTSTLWIAEALRAVGAGRVISVDHEARFARATEDALALRKLGDVATVVHAPLAALPLDDQTWRWYDPRAFLPLIDADVDLVIVDGPPGKLQARSRYPALSILWKHLAPSALVILDDAARRHERAIARLWTAAHPELTLTELPHGKGIALFERTRPT